MQEGDLVGIADEEAVQAEPLFERSHPLQHYRKVLLSLHNFLLGQYHCLRRQQATSLCRKGEEGVDEESPGVYCDNCLVGERHLLLLGLQLQVETK